MNTLGQRVITAAVLVVVLLATVFLLPPRAGVAVAGALFVLAAWEWSRFPGWRRTRARGSYALAVGLLLLAALVVVPERVSLTAVLYLSLAWWVVAFAWICRYPTPVSPVLAAVAGPLVLLPAWLGVAMLLERRPEGPPLLLALLAIVWAADIGAYFVGRRIGRVRLAPRVSPGKTWEGLGGGLLGGTLAALGAGLVLDAPPLGMAAAGLSVAAISVVGDLTESLFKRSVGLKDSGRIFPGHGGVLDRIDSITAAMPLFLLEATWLGLLQP